LGNESSALLTLKVKLAVAGLSVLVLEFVGVAVVSMHFAVTIRNTSVTEENQELMRGFWVLRSKVPEISRIISVGEVG
jgi:hypothetical protein